MKEKKFCKDKLYAILFFICSILFALPSAVYLVKNKSIYEFISGWTYFLRDPINQNEKLLNAILFFVLMTLLFLFYMIIIKKHNNIFKNKKQIFIFIAIISAIFLIIIPYTSTDVYSYIAHGWSQANYDENPYYTSVGDVVRKNQVNEPMFNKVATCWRYETVVYGPLWTLACRVLSGLSFGNIDIALLIYKIANFIVHMVCCALIYKITRKKIHVLIYGLNPLILFEAIANVHNDIFIVLFILLSIYFVVRKKNLFMSVAFLAMATAVKYLAILLLPFIVIYAVRNKEVKDRFKTCIYCGIEYIAIIVLIYLVYLKDLNVLAGLFIQQGKYNRSIFYLIYEFSGQNTDMVSKLQTITLGIFAIYYIYVVIKLLFQKEIKFYKAMQKYHIILLIFTFILITNFNSWYIMWLFPTVFFLKGKSTRSVMYLSYTGQIANIMSFTQWSEAAIYGIPYFVIMMAFLAIFNLMDKSLKEDKIKRIRGTKK